jgi:hypothetical protein
MIGQQIPRISVPGYDFGTTTDAAPDENGTDAEKMESVADINAVRDPVATQKRYRRTRSVARRR